MNENVKSVLSSVPQQPCRRDGPREQLAELTHIAKKFGLDDAAEYLNILLSERPNRSSETHSATRS